MQADFLPSEPLRNIPQHYKGCVLHTANILNGEKLKAFPLRAGTRQGCLMSPLFYQHSFESPNHSNQRTEAKGIQTGKKLKLCLWLT